MLLWIILAVLSQQLHWLYAPLNGKGKWALHYFCSSKNDQVGILKLESPYNWKNASEMCANICDKTKNCFFANVERGNQFRCTLLKDCSELVFSGIPIVLNNGSSVYQKGLNYKQSPTGVWASNFYCTSEKKNQYFWADNSTLTDNEAREICAIGCEKDKDCFFANLKRENGFRCTLLKACSKLLSTSTSRYLGNLIDLYQKVRIPDLRCTFDAIIGTNISVLIRKDHWQACASGCDESDYCFNIDYDKEHKAECTILGNCTNLFSGLDYFSNSAWYSTRIMVTYEKVTDTQLDEKNYIRNRRTASLYGKGKWALRSFCSSKNDQVATVRLESQYNWKNASEICANICDEMKNCFFANLVHDNQFRCILLKDCSELVSTQISIFHLGTSLYQKGLNYKQARTGVWTSNFYCTSEKKKRYYFVGRNEA